MGDKLALPAAMDVATRLSGWVIRTAFAPPSFKASRESIAVAMIYGHELGFSPMQSLKSIAVINGQPAVYGDGLMALCLSHPDCESIDESFDDETMTAKCVVKRRGHAPYTFSFSQNDAETAKLWNKKGPWQEYPKRMLQMRARGFALRDKFADALKGIITVEEAVDYPTTVPVEAILAEQVNEFPEELLGTLSEKPEKDQDTSRDCMPPPATPDETAQRVTDATYHFGKYKDRLLSDPDVPASYLLWYRTTVSKSAKDPDRMKFRQRNLTHLKDIDGEIAVREIASDAQRDHIEQDMPDNDVPW